MPLTPEEELFEIKKDVTSLKRAQKVLMTMIGVLAGYIIRDGYELVNNVVKLLGSA